MAGQDVSQLSPQELEARVVQIFEQSCARSGCHAGPNPQQGMFLTEEQFYASTVNEPSREMPELMRVHPGRPASSYLMMKVKGEPGIIGTKMPLVGELSEEEIRTIEVWIQNLEVDEARMEQVAESEAFPFDGWKVINLPTSRSVDAGSVLFRISHRFNPTLSDGYDAFFGLDGSGIILLSLGYAFTDDFLVNLGRSNSKDDVELDAHYRVAQEGGESGWPLGASVHGTVNWVSQAPSDPDDSRLRGEALKFTGQVSLTREVNDRIGVAVVPGVLFNPVEGEEGENPIITIGVGGRWNFYQNLSLIGEWVPIVSGFDDQVRFDGVGNQVRFDSWGGGLEITTGGHVFQIVLSNATGLSTDQYLGGGDLDVEEVLDGDVRLGFNIFRILNF